MSLCHNSKPPVRTNAVMSIREMIQAAYEVDLIGVNRGGDLWFVIRSEATDSELAKWESVLSRHFEVATNT